MQIEVSGEIKRPVEETRLGIADVERILNDYWRTPRVKSELERYRTRADVRTKQRELDNLERELAGRRFAFLQRGQTSRDVQEKKAELQSLLEKEAQHSREREREGFETLLSDIQRSADAVGRKQQLTVIFDSNAPHILFVDRDSSGIVDVTDTMIQDLNF